MKFELNYEQTKELHDKLFKEMLDMNKCGDRNSAWFKVIAEARRDLCLRLACWR